MSDTIPPTVERELHRAAEQRASDVYFLPDEPAAFRVRGEIVRSDGRVLSSADVAELARALLGPGRVERIAAEGGRLVAACDVPGVISGSAVVTSARGRLALSIRLAGTRVPPPDEIGLPQAVREAGDARDGLIVFAGLTGSGKVTSAYSLLEHINATQARLVCTVGEPSGITLQPKRSLVQQREVGTDVPDVSAGVAAALQQNADVLLVETVRSAAEVNSCVTAAHFGHLVVITLNASTPESAVACLLEVQPPDHLPQFRRALARVLRCVCAQVLLPDAKSGGRVVAYGTLVPDAGVRRAIAEGTALTDVAGDASGPPGSQSMRAEIDRLRRAGRVDAAAADEALRVLDEGW